VDLDLSQDVTRELSEDLEGLYRDDLDCRLEPHGLERDRRDGFDAFVARLRKGADRPLAVKGQVTGPISWGLQVTDRNRRPLLYNDAVADALARHLKLAAAWQEKGLRAFAPTTIISVDEPYLASIGSAFVSFPREQVVTLVGQVLSGIKGLKAIHCCGNTDWSVLLSTPVDILNFDAYNYGETLSLYPAEVTLFLDRGGAIAWGIVPNDEETLAKETEASLVDRLDETMRMLARKGVSYDALRSRCLITPSCGLGTMSAEGATRALEMTAAVSARFRRTDCARN
jgi:methionine synthase II (cobalamin-independent)